MNPGKLSFMPIGYLEWENFYKDILKHKEIFNQGLLKLEMDHKSATNRGLRLEDKPSLLTK